MKNKYLFKSTRLGFRNWKTEDLLEFAKLNADEAVMEHFPKTLSNKEVIEFIGRLKRHFEENGFTYFATEILETKEFIGMIGLALQKYKTEFTPAIDIGCLQRLSYQQNNSCLHHKKLEIRKCHEENRHDQKRGIQSS